MWVLLQTGTGEPYQLQDMLAVLPEDELEDEELLDDELLEEDELLELEEELFELEFPALVPQLEITFLT